MAQDLDAFADESFDPVAWLNAVAGQAIAAPNGGKNGAEGDDALHAHLTGVGGKLQQLSADLSDDLEKNMLEVMAAVPKTMHEIERIESSVRGLASGLESLLEQLEDIDSGTNAHVELLADLDVVAANMRECMATLTEAANWNQLVRDVHARFASGDLSGVAERLDALQKSMAVLQSMPEAGGRAATLAQLQTQLEELIKPRLQQALQKERVAPLSEFVDMFRRLGKLDQLQLEYARSRPAVAHKHWFSWGGAGQEPFASWLPAFLEQVMGMLMDERRRAAELFGHDAAPGVLCQLLVHTFEPIAESFLQRLNDRTSLSWPAATALYPETLSFASQALPQLNGAGRSALLAALLTITAPFQSLQDDFSRQERAHLKLELSPAVERLSNATATSSSQQQSAAAAAAAAKSSSNAGAARGVDGGGGNRGAEVVDLDELELLAAEAGHGVSGSGGHSPLLTVVEEVAAASTAAFPAVRGSLSRCLTLTAGYQGRALIRICSDTLSEFLGAVLEAMRAVRRAAGVEHLPAGLSPRSMPPSTSDASTASAAAGGGGRSSDGDFGVTESAAAGPAAAPQPMDWQALQAALQLLRAAGRGRNAVAAFEQELCAALLQARPELLEGGPPALDNMDTAPPSAAALAAGLAWMRLEEGRGARTELKSALSRLQEASLLGDALPAPARDADAVAAEAASLVFDACFAPVKAWLHNLRASESWAREERRGEEDEAEDSYGGYGGGAETGPQPYATAVGEHLLGLLQQLEPFAASDARKDAAHALGGVAKLGQAGWGDVGSALKLPDGESVGLKQVADGVALSADALARAAVGGSLAAPDSADDDASAGLKGAGAAAAAEEGDEEEEAAGHFCNEWLLAVARSAAGALLAEALRVPRFSASGAAQLAVDAAYLLNVHAALDVPPHPMLPHLQHVMALDAAAAAEYAKRPLPASPAFAVVRRIEGRLLAARGVALAP